MLVALRADVVRGFAIPEEVSRHQLRRLTIRTLASYFDRGGVASRVLEHCRVQSGVARVRVGGVLECKKSLLRSGGGGERTYRATPLQLNSAEDLYVRLVAVCAE